MYFFPATTCRTGNSRIHVLQPSASICIPAQTPQLCFTFILADFILGKLVFSVVVCRQNVGLVSSDSVRLTDHHLSSDYKPTGRSTNIPNPASCSKVVKRENPDLQF
ncbi:Hypothetical predicted protein [Scomber scombrus]|uniref:Uncharacterized protein n=1 Tax=Scomber scombrus TaxID=13677 RepID=A0AAV1N1S8_SCOSC